MARRTVTKINPKDIMGEKVENSVKKETKPKTTRNTKKKTDLQFTELTETVLLPISPTSTLHFKIVEVNGDPKVDIRTYVETPNFSGLTQKGIHFGMEHLEDFIMTLVGLAEDFQGDPNYFED